MPESPPPPPAPPTAARRALPAAVPPPRGSTGARSGAHQTGRSLPLPRGPATAGVTGRASQKLQRCPPRAPRLADAISRVAHNSERGPDTSAALPGSGPRPRPGQSGGETLEGRGLTRSLDQLQLGRAGPAPGVHAVARTAQAHPASFSLAGNLERTGDAPWGGLSENVFCPLLL